MNQINPVIATFTEEFNAFKAENHRLLSDLKAAVQDHLGVVEEVLDDSAADLKATLGADAANDVGADVCAQESAIAEAEGWVADNVSNGKLEDRIAVVLWLEGREGGELKLRDNLPPAGIVTARLTLDVTYALNGENAADMVSTLRLMCERAIGKGLLTGESSAVVEKFSMDVALQPKPLSEDDVANFMLHRIESGGLALEDIPVRMARYGLMESSSFVAEVRERMAMSKANE